MSETLDLFVVIAEPVIEPPAIAERITLESPLTCDLMALMHAHRSISVFDLGRLFEVRTGRSEPACSLWAVMDDLERAGRVACDLTGRERVWHLIGN